MLPPPRLGNGGTRRAPAPRRSCGRAGPRVPVQGLRERREAGSARGKLARAASRDGAELNGHGGGEGGTARRRRTHLPRIRRRSWLPLGLRCPARCPPALLPSDPATIAPSPLSSPAAQPNLQAAAFPPIAAPRPLARPPRGVPPNRRSGTKANGHRREAGPCCGQPVLRQHAEGGRANEQA